MGRLDALASLAVPRLLRPLDDRLNPILVKEIRAALRGRVFRIGFLCTIVLLTVTSLTLFNRVGLRPGPDEGQAYFLGILTCLEIAVIGLVPFSTFSAMGAEWDENTYDLLVISNMQPLQIVRGKLACAVVQTLLIFSAFAPFLVFAFLLRGVDLSAVVLILVLVVVSSVLGPIPRS